MENPSDPSDPSGIGTTMNIKQLLDHDGIKLKKQNFREFSAPCPWCGCRDRFRVWPDEDGSAPLCVLTLCA